MAAALREMRVKPRPWLTKRRVSIKRCSPSPCSPASKPEGGSESSRLVGSQTLALQTSPATSAILPENGRVEMGKGPLGGSPVLWLVSIAGRVVERSCRRNGGVKVSEPTRNLGQSAAPLHALSWGKERPRTPCTVSSVQQVASQRLVSVWGAAVERGGVKQTHSR